MTRKNNKKPYLKINRYLNIMIALTIIMPILCYTYLIIRAGMMSTNIQLLFTTYPDLAIIFLIAMIHPYMAYLLLKMKKKIANHDFSGILLEVGILMIAEIMMNNYVYLILLAIIFYQINKVLGLSIRRDIRLWLKEFTFKQNGGSLLVIAMSCICLFATIRLM